LKKHDHTAGYGFVFYSLLFEGNLLIPDYAIRIEEVLKATAEGEVTVIKYAIKLYKMHGEELLRYDYVNSSYDNRDGVVWLDLPHLHLTNAATQIRDIAKVHFPTYLSPDGLAPFKHGDNLRLYHESFLFQFLDWVRLEFWPRMENQEDDAKIEKHKELVDSIRRHATVQ
jgi:hypothetical protein